MVSIFYRGLVSSLVTAAALVTGSAAQAAAGRDATVIAECAIPTGLEHRLVGFMPVSFAEDDAAARDQNGPRILLVHDAAGYDILFDNQVLGRTSLRRAGAEISAPAPSSRFLQVMVQQRDLREQYLFSFDAAGDGMLMWVGEYRAAGEAAQNTPSIPARAMCRQLALAPVAPAPRN